MKLIIRQYLAALKERDELDAILPDLLSQLGLNVYSRPGRGTRQDGVDVGAVGALDDGTEKVYLFSIKPGDLTRRAWDGDSAQSLRPSLNEILDAYIPNRLPAEHRDRPVVICITIGGDIQEQVRPQVTGFIAQHTTDKISFEEWNGDKLASLIQANFLREDLLPREARSQLRKALALLDEPEASYQHFARLIRSFSAVGAAADAERVRAIRQMSLCLWILFAWAREAGNVESAYRAGELTLLHGWNLVRRYAREIGQIPSAIESALFSIFSAYQQICSEFLRTNVLPHAGKQHAISTVIRAGCSLDANLKLFDILGRLGLDGIWALWGATAYPEEEKELRQRMLAEANMYASSIKALISANPALFLPIKDDHIVDISIAVLLLAWDPQNHADIKRWIAEIVERARFAYQTNGKYPCTLDDYSELLLHPKLADGEYRKAVTCGSVLYPMIALWAALLNDEETYRNVAEFKQQSLQHCNFQFWYPDDQSEEHFYANSDLHGAILSDACVDRPADDLVSQAFGECEHSPQFNELSAVKFQWWPLILIACRHYRFPLPLHLFRSLRKTPSKHRSENSPQASEKAAPA
jgi:hypothetical protein